jgi:hypothetical protein
MHPLVRSVSRRTGQEHVCIAAPSGSPTRMTSNESDMQTTAGTLREELDGVRDDERADRPDQRGPRGNQEIEAVDVERGEENIGRVLGW